MTSSSASFKTSSALKTAHAHEKSKLAHASIFIIHVVLAGFILSLLYGNYSKRHAEYQSVEDGAVEAKLKMEKRQEEVDIHKSLLNGLQDDDPYVIEKFAREKYGYTGYNELSPPKP